MGSCMQPHKKLSIQFHQPKSTLQVHCRKDFERAVVISLKRISENSYLISILVKNKTYFKKRLIKEISMTILIVSLARGQNRTFVLPNLFFKMKYKLSSEQWNRFYEKSYFLGQDFFFIWKKNPDHPLGKGQDINQGIVYSVNESWIFKTC